MTRPVNTSIALALAAFLAFSLEAAPPAKKSPLTQEEALALKNISKDKLKSAFKDFLKEADNQKYPTPLSLSIRIRLINRFCEHPFFEVDTGFKIEWLKNVREHMTMLVSIQTQKRMCKIAGSKKEYAANDAEFNTIRSKLEQLMKHPEKVPQKRLQALRQKAFKIRQAIRKKLEASGWRPPPKPATQPKKTPATAIHAKHPA
jgi:hypothetical protein